MWKGFSHCSSFMMLLRHELLEMYITLTGFLVLIYYPNWVTGLAAFRLTLKNTLCFRQKQ
jgi:hypothetical protein